MAWVVVILALMIPLVAVILDSQVGRALAARLEGKDAQLPEENAVARRLAALESEVERLNAELLRLEEETSFLQRLLEARPPRRGDLPPAAEQ